MRTQRLRHRLLHVAGRVSTHARSTSLRLPRSWPCATALLGAFTRLRALPCRLDQHDEPRQHSTPSRPARPEPGSRSETSPIWATKFQGALLMRSAPASTMLLAMTATSQRDHKEHSMPDATALTDTERRTIT